MVKNQVIVILTAFMCLLLLGCSANSKSKSVHREAMQEKMADPDHHEAMAEKHTKVAECLRAGNEKQECFEEAGMHKHGKKHRGGSKGGCQHCNHDGATCASKSEGETKSEERCDKCSGD